GAGVPRAAEASRARIRRGRDGREDSRDGCPTTAPSLFMVPMRAKYGMRAFHARNPLEMLETLTGAPGGKLRVQSSREAPSQKGWQSPSDRTAFRYPSIHDQNTVLPAERIGNTSRAIGIVPPLAIHQVAVFILAHGQSKSC